MSNGHGPGGLEAFLVEALKRGSAIDLQPVAGPKFSRVTVTGLLHGAIQVEKVMRADGKARTRQWVVAIDKIVWGVLS